MNARLVPLIALALLTALTGLTAACGAAQPNRNPTGEPFPTVRGYDLSGQAWTLPADAAGEPIVLLVGYVQDSQFDIDRWLLGLLQAETPVAFVELPTIDGMLPSMFAGSIDNGMRSGIPSDDWGGVVTLYSDDAERVVELTGDTNPRNTRVLLLDERGRVVWFHDEGYSARVMMELDAIVRARSELAAHAEASERR